MPRRQVRPLPSDFWQEGYHAGKHVAPDAVAEMLHDGLTPRQVAEACLAELDEHYFGDDRKDAVTEAEFLSWVQSYKDGFLDGTEKVAANVARRRMAG